MRAVLQRVSSARVSVDGEVVGQVGGGFVALVGVGPGDDADTADDLARTIAQIRVIADDEGRMNRSVLDTGGAVLVISQFTLFADTSRGRRPSFVDAADPEVAEPLVARVAVSLRDMGLEVAEGRFGAHMEVELVNDGPVTIVLDTAR